MISILELKAMTCYKRLFCGKLHIVDKECYGFVRSGWPGSDAEAQLNLQV
jgi:hypothetical protein